MYWKIKRTSPPDILLLTHYIMRSHFFFALMHGCSHAPPECRGLHVCATCCVCCGDGASWRWMRSAVWNSADPLKWLLVATREREREGGDLRGEHADRCLTPTLDKTHTQSMFSVDYREIGLNPFPLIDSKSHIQLICTWTKAIPSIHSAPFPGRKWIVCSAQ